mgnify:CR=1 FL=1
MIAAIFLAPAFIGGALFGVFLAALMVAAHNRGDDDDE